LFWAHPINTQSFLKFHINNILLIKKEKIIKNHKKKEGGEQHTAVPPYGAQIAGTNTERARGRESCISVAGGALRIWFNH